MKSQKLFILFLFTLFLLPVQAQIHGLWEAVHVSVGTEEMTPIAKWTEIKEDGTFISGNGWLQNSDGSWKFDQTNSELTMIPKTGFEDPFGSFKVNFQTNAKMIWEREEEGQKVIVQYERISSIPKSWSDLATGIWDLKTATREGMDAMEEFDPTGDRFIFLRWDKLFTDYTSEGRISGIWRIGAHSSALDILYYDNSKSPNYWQYSFEGDNEMIWKMGEVTLTFSRLNSFPE
ncbi:MAG: hypothetical protein BalsKO_19770 [Balneolaceae bacterium]